ncbi:MAG: hypoxanthine-guanine phosphoribosyltransferase [Wenzhouxiangellaceae bacterium]|nr:hypoxanthine-guanine phosphoribosyltransferase [Wenzhouxiangellaceae bacterium]
MPNLPEGSEKLYTQADVQAAYDGLAERLNAELPKGELLLLSIMTGALFPTVEIAQRLNRPLTFDYVHASRYRGETSGGDVQWHRWPEIPSEARTILIVDDIFDEGYTLQAIRQRLAKHHHVVAAVLAIKQHSRGLGRHCVDYFGLEVPDRYVFGCGMDYQERFRELPEIWALPEQN